MGLLKRQLFATLSVVLGAGCATSPEAAERASDDATLEIENRTHDDLLVSVRGRAEATVRSGARVRVHHLVPGAAELAARAADGGAGAFVATRTLTLARGDNVWTVLPDAAGGEALPPVPGLGALHVDNTTTKSVVVLINGARVGRVFAGQSRTFDDVPEGVALVAARPDDGAAGAAGEVAIVAHTTATWRVEDVGAELFIRNQTDEALEIAIDGIARGRVAAGATWTNREGPGVHVIAARSVPSQRPYEIVLELGTAAPTTWEVTAGQAALAIENTTGEALAVDVPGRGQVSLGARETTRLEGLATGSIALAARGADSGLAYAARLELLPGQVATWVVGPIAGSLRIENRARRAVTIYLGAGKDEVERGRVASGGVVVIRDLARTNVVVAAIEDGILKRQTSTFDLSETPAATWVITSASGAVRVTNARDEAVDAFVDARRVGEVAARGERTFTGIELGERLVETVGQRSGVPQRERLVVSEEALAQVAVHDTNAWLVVDNTSGEAVTTRGLLAEQHAEIAAGTSLRFKVPAGGARVAVVGRDSGLVYGRRVEVPPGETATWSVTIEPARLIVWSKLLESAALTIDGRAQGSIAPDETLVIDGVAPGRHRLQVVGLTSGLVRSEDMAAAPGGEHKVTFATELGVLLVENRAQEPVEVTIDGAHYGDAAGGTLHAFGAVAPGRRAVELYFEKSHRTQKIVVDVREGQRARIVAEAPMGLLVIDNGSRQDVRVEVDGRTVATVPSDAGPTLVSAPAGVHHVRVERLGDRSQLGFELEVRADSAVHLPVPPRSVRLVVVNRTDVALTLFIGEHQLATLQARTSEMIETLPEDVVDGRAGNARATVVRLLAKDAEGRITHEEERRLYAGETGTWVLSSP